MGFVVKDVSAKVKDKYDQAVAQYGKDGDVNKLFDAYKTLGWELPPEVTKGESGTYTKAVSSQQKEINLAGGKAYAEAQAKDDAKDQNELLANYKSAPTQVALANEARSLAKAAPNAFKLLNNKDYRTWWDGLSAAAKDGMITPGGSFSIPTDIIEQAGLTNTEIQALQSFASIEAKFSLTNARTYLKGEGSVSDMERRLVSALGTRASDRPEVIQMKADAIELRAQYDRNLYQAYDAWRDNNPNTPMRKFATSAEMDKVVDDYEAKGKSLIKANAEYIKQGASTTANPTTTAKPATNTAKPIATTPDTTKPVKTPETFMQRLNRLREEDKKGKP